VIETAGFRLTKETIAFVVPIVVVPEGPPGEGGFKYGFRARIAQVNSAEKVY
jgi:hypothetical protein